MQIHDYSHCKSFDDMGKILYQDDEITLRAGQIFEAKTVKGHTNLIITGRVVNGDMVYFHGDKAKKVKLDQFISAVQHGELQPRHAKEIDTERLSMAAIGIDAIANRRTGEEQINYYGEGAEERYRAAK